MPWTLTAVALLVALGAWRLVMYHAPTLMVAAFGFWGFWMVLIYESMVVMHVLGLICYRHAAGLGWFRGSPRWGAWERPGKIYTNS